MTNNDSFPSRSEINEWITEIKASDKVKKPIQYGLHGMPGWILSHDEISLLVQKAADRELNACCDWLDGYDCDGSFATNLLRDCRRPKAPTLEELALQYLSTIEKDNRYLPEITGTIRKALTAKIK